MSSWPISAEEFSERYLPSTRWPFSAAISISLAAHALVLSAVMLWFDVSDIAREASIATPVFDVSLSRANATQESGRDSKFIADSQAPADRQLAIQESNPAPAKNQSPVVSIKAPPQQEPKTETPDPTAPIVDIETAELTPTPTTSRVEETVASTESNSNWQVSVPSEVISTETVPEKIPLSPFEQEMLEQQLREWQDDFELLDQTEKTFTWQQGNQSFQASIDQQAPQNNTDLERAVVEISTEVDGVRMSTQMAFKRLAFSHYAQLVDRWDRDVSLSEDEINGRFHSNSRIVVAPERRAEPKFSGKVTVASSVSMRGLTRADVFLGGLETRVKPIQLPTQLLGNSFEPNDEPREPVLEYSFETDGQITFQAEGGFHWRDDVEEKNFICTPQCVINAGEDVVLSVEGIVKGTVVINAEDTIRISGNLVYAQHPIQFSDSDDFLGLLSENYIEIAPPTITGPGDLTIHGALYAKRRFVVRNFRNRNNGLLSLFGSLTAGSLSASEPRFATRIDFDPRFEDQRIPNYPLTDKFELDAWDRQWTIENSP
jgi:outer membrane biosynthesis protein TonB